MRERQFAQAVLQLFKAVPQIKATEVPADNNYFLRHGIYITPEAAAQCDVNRYKKIIADAFGYDLRAINKGAFYSSFQKAYDASPEQRIVDTLLHYFSVFIPEALGIGYQAIVPAKDIELPEEDEPLKVTVITSISNQALEERVLALLSSGVALKQEALENLLTIIKYLGLQPEVDQIKNKEFRVILCKELGLVPGNPIEFLRYVNYLLTNKTALIKNRDTVQGLQHWQAQPKSNRYYVKRVLINGDVKVKPLFDKYMDTYGAERLSSIFLRYKPLFLALKSHPGMAAVINRLRRLAVEHHKAKKQEILDLVTSSQNIDVEALMQELERVTIFKKISLLNAIKQKLAQPQHRMFNVRNGKMFVKTDVDHKEDSNLSLLKALECLLENHIAAALKPQFQGKKVYMPESVVYAAPTSEKKIFNGIPFGTRIYFAGNALVGIHWENLSIGGHESRVDLDLHISSNNIDLGWNNYHYQTSGEIIFTGDMVDAPIANGGATEAMYISEDYDFTGDILTVSLNRFCADGEVPYKFFLGQSDENGKVMLREASYYSREDVNTKERKYLVTAHEMALNINYKIDCDQLNIGLIKDLGKGQRVYYVTNLDVSRGIVAHRDEFSLKAAEAVLNSYDHATTLNELIEKAGGSVVHEKPEEGVDLDLSPENLAQDTLLSLFAAQ